MKKVFAALMAVVVAVSIVPLKANASAEQRLRLSNRLLVINVGRTRMVEQIKKWSGRFRINPLQKYSLWERKKSMLSEKRKEVVL